MLKRVLEWKHVNAYRIWKKNKYENRVHLIVNNYNNHVCTKFVLNISVL